MDILDIPRSSRESRRATSSRRREFPNNQEYRTTNLGDPYDYERAYVGSTRYGEFDPRQDDDRPYYDFDGPSGDFDYQSQDSYTPGYLSRGYGEDEECDPGVSDDYGYGRSDAYGRSTYSYGYSADVDQARQYSYKQGSSRRTGRTSGSYARGYDEGPSRGTAVDVDYQPGSSVPSTEEMWMWSPSERNWVVVSHLHDTGNSTGCHLIRLSLVKLLGYSRSKDINKNDVHNLDTIGGPVSTLGSIRIAYITSTHKDEQQEAKFHVFDSNRASGYDVIFATGSADGGLGRRDLWTITHGKRKLPNGTFWPQSLFL